MNNPLAKLEAGHRALAEAKTFDDFKSIHDIAVAAESYARAHKLGIEAENYAREIKLIAARKMGELIPAQQGKRTDMEHVRIADKLPDKQRLSEFRKLAQIPEPKFRERIAKLKAREEKITYPKLLSEAHVSHATGEKEWYTPPDIIEAARKTMGDIDCDPATSELANKIVQAQAIFTSRENGLEREWRGRVWMNPPYAQPLISEFSDAVSSKYEKGEISEACVLVNNATETAWFQRMLRLSSAVCFITGRVRFINTEGEATGAPLQGQAVIYLGPNHGEFYSAFSAKGVVLYGPGKN